jgi:dTDP-4-amino-4,6-dideoxygalactose transaminase
MTPSIPFLRPSLPVVDDYVHLLRSIDETHLYSNYGPLCSRFEAQTLASSFQNQGGFCTVANATIGLMLAIQLAKRKGRYAIMPSFTFAATPLAAQWAGLEPWFVDVDPHTWCMDLNGLTQAISELGEEVAVVVPYATFGTGMALEPYTSLQARGIPVVIDAAASFGTKVLEDSAQVHFGLGFPGYIVFSFHATKAFGIGEGGGVYSGDAEAVARLKRAGNFGFASDRASCEQGLNSKMSEYAAALALATWEVYPEKIRKRQAIHKAYLDGLERSGLSGKGWQPQRTRGEVAFQFMPILCPPGQDRDQVVARMAERSIECRTYFSPACHQQHQFAACPHGGLAVTERLSRCILSLPLWEDMPEAAVSRVIEGLTG